MTIAARLWRISIQGSEREAHRQALSLEALRPAAASSINLIMPALALVCDLDCMGRKRPAIRETRLRRFKWLVMHAAVRSVLA